MFPWWVLINYLDSIGFTVKMATILFYVAVYVMFAVWFIEEYKMLKESEVDE